MVDRAATSRAEAIEDFAAALRALRAAGGTPSFREMSGRSHAISHTTLHEAAQGHRFPSWPTTAEFVKACGADPAEYRERWEQASRAVHCERKPPTVLAPGLAKGDDEATEALDEAHADEAAPAAAAPAPQRRSRYVLVRTAAVGVLAVGAVIVGIAVSKGDSPHPTGSGSSSGTRHLTRADCPVHQTNPPAAPPAHPGDASVFIGDITLPDCTHVQRGRTVTKVWRLKNVGTVPWVDYSLNRVDLPQRRDQCQTITDVPVEDTEPGELVDVRVAVTVPPKPGFCFVRFKMVDASGNVAFPGRRPVNFQIIID